MYLLLPFWGLIQLFEQHVDETSAFPDLQKLAEMRFTWD